jgi:transposase
MSSHDEESPRKEIVQEVKSYARQVKSRADNLPNIRRRSERVLKTGPHRGIEYEGPGGLTGPPSMDGETVPVALNTNTDNVYKTSQALSLLGEEAEKILRESRRENKAPDPLAPSTEYADKYPFSFPGSPMQQLLDNVEESGVYLLRAIKSGVKQASELTMYQRRLVVYLLRQRGSTQDEISAILDVSRRTIVSDFKALRELAASAVATFDPTILAGEIIQKFEHLYNKALSEGTAKMAAWVLGKEVDILQSLGLLYKAPELQKSMQLSAHISSSGASNYLEKIGPDRDAVCGLLDDVLGHLGES